MSLHDHINCPSHRCKPGSDLIGVRQDDGTVAILPQPLPVDQSFVDRVRRDAIAPEERFRFSNKCAEGGCEQWTGSRCGFIDRTLRAMEASLPLTSPRTVERISGSEPGVERDLASALPTCGIRPTCRWFQQIGGNACRVCPYIVTHVTSADTPLPLTAAIPCVIPPRKPRQDYLGLRVKSISPPMTHKIPNAIE
jgi:hypothetical protein